MKKIALSLILVISVCGSSNASSTGAKTSSGNDFKPDDSILRNWAIIKCQDMIRQDNGEDIEKLKYNAIDLSYSFRESPALHDRFNRCVDETLELLKRQYN